ncbi:MAG: DUF1385 domain-containing protein [Thermoleophilaceae bacterium]|nr:DUF1385 domain-containing protein [Thermoleophilaceae bacterium]
MALRNGLLVHGPTHWAAAVRTKQGELKTASGPKPHLGFEGVPGVRGVARLAEAMAVIPLVKRGLPEARLPMQDAKTLGAMVAAAAGGRLLRRAGTRTIGRESLLAVVSLAPALLSLRSGDIAAYHGVEHKAIAAYEQDEDAADALKEHDRCGSNLVAPMLASTVVGNVAARRAGLTGPRADALVGLGSVAFAVEVFAWSERHSNSALAALLRKPGHEIQRVVGTKEPSEEQLEVGRAAVEEILKVELANAE